MLQPHRPVPLTIAHRFGNEPALVRLAEEIGVDLVEADVWFHRGRLEVRHTKTLGPAPILWDRWSLEAGWKPRFQLDTLLRLLAEETTVMLDLKGRAGELPDRMVEEFRRHHPGRTLLVCSQNWGLLERFRAYPDVTLVHSIGNRAQLRQAWSRLERDDHDAVSIQYRLLSPDVVRALKARVSLVMSWPINDERRLRNVLAWGVDGIISDSPDLLRQVVRERSVVGVEQSPRANG